MRLQSIFLVIALFIAGCTTTTPAIGPDGQPLPQIYRISSFDSGRVQFRMLDAVNALRANSSLPPVELESKLTSAAATHSRDMSVQNRPWHFGSDGSSPLDRVARTGYAGPLIGEVISETYETELQTLAAWMEQDDTRRIILSPDARNLGFSWFQESNGKLWWTMILGG
jgi:uncharacterized protein YkwD